MSISSFSGNLTDHFGVPNEFLLCSMKWRPPIFSDRWALPLYIQPLVLRHRPQIRLRIPIQHQIHIGPMPPYKKVRAIKLLPQQPAQANCTPTATYTPPTPS